MAVQEVTAVTELLARCRGGEKAARDQLFQVVYSELRRVARGYLKRERENHTLEPTALVHEAYVRLVNQPNASWEDRTHFFATAAEIMRHILVDHARKRVAAKRGGAEATIALSDDIRGTDQRELRLLDVDEALTKLALIDPQQSKVVELRFFGGLTIEETAEALSISPATVKREWTMARAWLHRELTT